MMGKILLLVFTYLCVAGMTKFAAAEEISVTSPTGIQPMISPRSSCKCCGELAPEIEIVYYDEIKDLPNHPEILLVDVREPEEIQQTGKIPTSINIPLVAVQKELGNDSDPEEFKGKYLRDKPNKDTMLIFSCRSGVRAQEAAECAVALGYTHVKSYKGSWNDWAKHEGLPH